MQTTMQRDVATGAAIDLAGNPVDPATGCRVLTAEQARLTDGGGLDFCDSARDHWIFSIGEHRETGQVLAAADERFYLHNDYTCIWLR